MNRREVSNRDYLLRTAYLFEKDGQWAARVDYSWSYGLDTMLQDQQCTSVMFTDESAKARFLRCSDVALASVQDFVRFFDHPDSTRVLTGQAYGSLFPCGSIFEKYVIDSVPMFGQVLNGTVMVPDCQDAVDPRAFPKVTFADFCTNRSDQDYLAVVASNRQFEAAARHAALRQPQTILKAERFDGRLIDLHDVAHRSGDFVIFAPDCNEEPALLLNTANNFRDAYRFKTMIRGVAYPVPIFSVKRRNTALPLLSRTPPIDITLTGQEVQS